MKKLFFSSLLSLLFIGIGFAQYDDEARSGYEGDFFSLEGALELFKDAHSIQGFERQLNSEYSYVNNLDLNYDGQTDYIRVEHKRSGRYHAVIMQAIINRRELQDVAVIEFERINGQQVMLQIVGDEDLYGERVVIESYDDEFEHYNDRYVNAYYWPIMQNIFAPTYACYVSPYAYSYYPGWYRPWNTFGWNVFYPRIVRYRRFCRVAPRYRLTNVYNFYRPYRRYCPSVRQNTVVVRSTRGRNSYYYGSNSRINRGNNVSYNSNSGRRSARANTKPQGTNNSNRSYGATGKNSSRAGGKIGAANNRPSKNPRTSASRPTVKNNTVSRRPNVKNNSSKHNSGSKSYQSGRKPSASKHKPTRSYKPNNTVKKPAQRPLANKPKYNRPAKRPTVSKSSGSNRGGSSRGSVRKPSSSRSSSVRTTPKRSTTSAKPTRSSKPAARSGSNRGGSSRGSVRKPSSSRSSSVRTAPKRSTSKAKTTRSSKPTTRSSSKRPSSSKPSVSSRGKASSSRNRGGRN